MRKLILNSVTLCLAAQLATAQIKLPSPSPGATVMQTVGVTDLTVKYSRPSLKGRTPFTDAFVPMGKVWRTGANQATAFTTSTDLTVNGQPLPAGTYAILSIPASDNWTLIFSKNTTVTEASYKQDDDALRVPIKATASAEPIETFTIGFTDLTDSTARMSLMWGSVKASADLAVNTSTLAAANVDRAVADKPNDPAVLQAAASYNAQRGRNLDQALTWIDQSIGAQETYRNLFVKAQILGRMGRYVDALPVARRALTLGQASNDGVFPFFKDAIEKSIADYGAKTPGQPVVKPKKGRKSA